MAAAIAIDDYLTAVDAKVGDRHDAAGSAGGSRQIELRAVDGETVAVEAVLVAVVG